jgi:hypothetical protein
MKKYLVLCVPLVVLIQSCHLVNLTKEEDVSSGDVGNSLVTEKNAPILTEEKLSCSHFVSPDGDDTMVGSESQPWASFQHAVDSVQPGDTVCFREGIYPVENVIQIKKSGTAEKLIIFAAYPGERPILDGKGIVDGMILLDQYSSYLRLSGFMLKGFRIWGLELSGENRYVFLDHLTVEGGEAGIHFTYGDGELDPPAEGIVDHIWLEKSVIYNSQYTGVDCTPGPCNNMIFRHVEVYGSGVVGESSFGADGIAISRGYPILVEDCYIHDNGGDGIDLNSRDRQGYAEDVIVRRNRVVRNRQNGIKLWAGGRLENNVIWGQGNSAVWLGTFNSKFAVVNNTIAFNMWDANYSDRNWAFSVGYPEENFPLPRVDLLLVNNIFAFNTGPEVGEPTGIYLGAGVNLTEHHNLYFSREDSEITAEFVPTDFTRQDIAEGVWINRTRQGQNNLVNDPLFRSAWPQVDLELSINSPAIDKGSNEFCPQDDSQGKKRPVDGNGDGDKHCDLGAFEWIR